MAQKRKASRKKPATKRPQRKKPTKQKITPVEEILFRVEGKMSTFGGARDTGMWADEGLALFTPADLKEPKYSYLFLPTPPPGTTGLGRRLNPNKYYFACRWNYNDTPREFLKRALARLENPSNGRAADARPVDWGPHISTGRDSGETRKGDEATRSCQSNCAAREACHQTVHPQPELFLPQGRNKDRQNCFALHRTIAGHCTVGGSK